MSSEPSEPSFAPPTPPGVLPADGLAEVSGTPAADRAAGTGATDAGPDDAGRTPRAASGAPRTVRRPRVATAAVAVLLLVTVGALTGLAAAKEREWAPVPAHVDAPRDAHAVQLVLGSCVAELPSNGPVEEVRVVPCGVAHEAQVVARHDSARDAVWPGHDVLVSLASGSCGPEALGPQGRELADGLRFVVWTPSADSWTDGDRTGLCLAAGDSLVDTLL